MATCAMMGQALGTAAAIALRNGLSPRGVYEQRIEELKQTLIVDDCYLPWNRRKQTPLMRKVQITGSGNVSALIDGIERPVNGEDHVDACRPGGELVVTLPEPCNVRSLRLITDSDLNRETFPEGVEQSRKEFPMKCNIRLDRASLTVPNTILREFDVYADDQLIFSEKNNYQRLIRIPLGLTAREICLVLKSTWGKEEIRFYALELME